MAYFERTRAATAVYKECVAAAKERSDHAEVLRCATLHRQSMEQEKWRYQFEMDLRRRVDRINLLHFLLRVDLGIEEHL